MQDKIKQLAYGDAARHYWDGDYIVFQDTTGKYYYKNGYRHREDGPAVEYINGRKEWRIVGRLHRMDGPAAIYLDREEWWINGCNATIEIQEWAKELNIDLNNLTEDDKVLIAIKWSDYEK